MQNAILQLQNNPEMVFPYPKLAVNPVKKPKQEGPRVVQMQPKESGGEKVKKPARLPEDRRRNHGKNTTDDRKSKVARIAIIACSVAVLLAIGILAMLLLNPFDNDGKMVTVPDLAGRVYNNLPSYPGLTIEIGAEVYDSYREAGQIISQDVATGTSVVKGTTIYVTVSKGPEPKIYKMKDVIGKAEAEAYTILTQMGIELKVDVVYEYKPGVKIGIVFNTKPAKDAVLTEGQTITLYVTEPATVEKSTMVDVVGKTETLAKNLLNGNKFNNIKIEYVASDTIPAGIVISQSVEKDKKIDVRKEIVLVVSSGPAVENPPAGEAVPDTTDAGNVG